MPSLSVAINLGVTRPSPAMPLDWCRDAKCDAGPGQRLRDGGSSDIQAERCYRRSAARHAAARRRSFEALTRNPSVLLLDEPTSALPSDREWLFGLIDSVLKEAFQSSISLTKPRRDSPVSADAASFSPATVARFAGQRRRGDER